LGSGERGLTSSLPGFSETGGERGKRRKRERERRLDRCLFDSMAEKRKRIEVLPLFWNTRNAGSKGPEAMLECSSHTPKFQIEVGRGGARRLLSIGACIILPLYSTTQRMRGKR
jgi:hypothetical protein